MSARRQASTTSLAKFARAHSPEFADNSLDFCNAFWGANDAGVEVLFARMRGALRTTEELRNFWKERAIIEEQYGKKLASLAKMTVGRDEVGELRASLDTMRAETEKQASYHLALAQQVKNDLEGATSTYIQRQLQHKKGQQAAIERDFKLKQQQEGHVNRAREKYEADCMRINSYTAQATLMQGKELENVQAKLKRAQATVGANEQDFQKFTRVLQETTVQWEQNWKVFCDSCQDMEEERMDFMKDNLWSYANAVSTVCVNDDEACEKMRLVLEQLEPIRDMAGFVRTYGTGNAIPDPPHFINYADPHAVAAQRPTARPAQFQRVTERVLPMFAAPPPAEEQPDELENTAGIGAGGGISRSRSASRASNRGGQSPPQAQAGLNITNGRNGTSSRTADAQAPPIAPGEKSMIKIGNRAYEVDLANDPQSKSGPSPAPGSSSAPARVGDEEDDPLARQMVELQRGATTRRNTQNTQPPTRPPAQAQSSSHRSTPQSQDSTSQLSPPPGGRGGGPPNKVDYRRSAEIVVGVLPTNSRPASPNPPAPALARPPSVGHARDDTVQEVLNNYQRSLPGEHKSVSRSRAGSYSSQGHMQAQQQRPDSMAGVGARGRSPSPQPFRPPSRGVSPNAQPQQGPTTSTQRTITPAHPSSQQLPRHQSQSSQDRRQSYRGPPLSSAVATPISQVNGVPRPGHQASQNSISVPTQPINRSASPNHVGISLDPSGRVAHDELADRYNNSQMYHPPPSTAPQQPSYAPPTQHNVPQRAPSYPPPNQQPTYSHTPAPAPAPAPTMYNGPGGYAQQAPPPQQPVQQQPNQSYGGQPYSQYPSQQGYAPPNGRGVQRNGSYNASPSYYGNMHHQPPPVQQEQPPPPQQQYAPPNALVHNQGAPSPQQEPQGQPMSSPTGAYTDDGRPILFYVTALYDYQASIPEEFDFQTGDVIAVTATPEDGWWSGELLDEARRQPGRHVFPSNFVQLF